MAKREQEGKLLNQSFYFSPLHRTPDGPMLRAAQLREVWVLDSQYEYRKVSREVKIEARVGGAAKAR